MPPLRSGLHGFLVFDCVRPRSTGCSENHPVIGDQDATGEWNEVAVVEVLDAAARARPGSIRCCR